MSEVDRRLVKILRRAGAEWGPLGVATVAAQLAGHRVVPVPETPPVPIEIKREGGPRPVVLGRLLRRMKVRQEPYRAMPFGVRPGFNNNPQPVPPPPPPPPRRTR